LKRRQLASAQTQSSSGLKRAFTTKRKGWDQKEVFEALAYHVGNCGSPGVAESLIAKLIAAGGDMNVAQKAKTNILNRRSKSIEDFGERRKLLQMAIQHSQVDMVQVLLPHADPLAIDTSLPMAIRSENAALVELLLRYGASAAQTADGQDAFRQTCALGGQPDLVGLILASDGRPSLSWVSQSLVHATQAGCLGTVLRLSRSTADGNYNKAEALKIAVSQGRKDIALALIVGNKPPQRPGVDEAFAQLFVHPTIHPNEKLAMTELLLCAGAEGDVLTMALDQAAESEFLEMVHLLVEYGAPIENEDARVVRGAISTGRVDLVQVLLSGASSFSPIHASECVELVPKKMSFEYRHVLLSALLRKGAAGVPLSDALIDCVEDGDLESARLLLTPQFPGGRLAESHDLRKGPRGMVYDRHEIASVNHKGGLALQIAVMKTDVQLASLILSGKPSEATFAAVFPMTRTLSPIDRYSMVECFLSSGMTGPCVHEALQEAIDEKPPQKDERLISLFLQYISDVNFNEGSGLSAAIAQKDVKLLSALLKKNVTPQTAANAMSKAMIVDDTKARLEMASLLLDAGAGIDVTEVSRSMLLVLKKEPIDVKLLRLLLQQGNADVNIRDGVAIATGM
jgi:hypothetical protein